MHSLLNIFKPLFYSYELRLILIYEHLSYLKVFCVIDIYRCLQPWPAEAKDHLHHGRKEIASVAMLCATIILTDARVVKYF